MTTQRNTQHANMLRKITPRDNCSQHLRVSDFRNVTVRETMKGKRCRWKIFGTIVLIGCCFALYSFLSFDNTYYEARLEIVSDKILSDKYALHNNASIRIGAIKLLQAPNDKHPDDYSIDANVTESSILQSSIAHVFDTRHAETEVRHIGFVKVHKAASSTMQNIFFRFGRKRGLTFVFTVHPNYFSRTSKFSLPLVKPSKRSSYDILCNHGVFNKTIYSAILPKDTIYLAIVRRPLDLFISSVNYYTQRRYLLDYLARVPGNKLQNLIQKPEVYDRAIFSYTRNVLARDLGFPATDDVVTIDQTLRELDKTMKLVLLVEYFDESLILMRRYLNWKLEDILYISNNVYQKDGVSLNDLTPDDVVKFKERNSLDYYVYDFFYNKFWHQFNMERDDIYEEVLHFKRVLTKLKTFCNGEGDSSTDTVVINRSNWNSDTVITKEDCQYMKKEELVFIRELRAIQGSELKPPVGARRVVRPRMRRFPRAAGRRPLFR